MMLAINLGSRGLDQARNVVEYVNGPTGSYWGDLRARNGRADPFGVKYWCLGNEMDGPWQVGHKTAEEYGRLANETAKALRAFDRSLELVVCGSSNSYMPTYPQWERVVLEHTYEAIDHISLHMYFNNAAQNTPDYLAMNARLDEYIGTVASTINYVQAVKRSSKKVTISFDEWNVWYHSRQKDREILDGNSGWPQAPRLLEDVYNFEDVLQVGCILNTFIRRCDVVKIACIAQLVNVIAPIMTEPGGPAWRQSIYYPYFFASKYGRGTTLQLSVDAPKYDASVAGDVSYLDIAGVHDEEAGTITLFAVNRSLDESIDVEVETAGFGPQRIQQHQVMTHPDLHAANTLENPSAVIPRNGAGAAITDGTLTLQLPPLSYHVLRLQAEGA
jgi:alpha-N-arabinofuranosidase